jgi:undecaprenyl-diphosphatase
VIADLDRTLFALIHDHWRAPLLDRVMPVVTDRWFWALPLLALVAHSALRRRERVLRLVIASAVLLVLSDWCANTLKGMVRRPRPGTTVASMGESAGRAASYSLPSGHATNSFALATFWSLAHPELAVPLLGCASLVAYSRVYLGDHHPVDVLAGALLGATLGLIAVIVAGARGTRGRRAGPRPGSPVP